MDFNGFRFSDQRHHLFFTVCFAYFTLSFYNKFSLAFLFFATSIFLSKIYSYILNYKILYISVFFIFFLGCTLQRTSLIYGLILMLE